MDKDVPLTIGYLSSYESSKMALGAIPLAIETINADPTLLPGRRLQFVAADIGNPVGNNGLAMLAIRRMTEMRENNHTIAFIGPDGQCAAEALVAAAWNLPMITYVSCQESCQRRLFRAIIHYLVVSWLLAGVSGMSMTMFPCRPDNVQLEQFPLHVFDFLSVRLG